jgi:alpha-tubulin suppressor-like RCC1 family protein
VAGIDDAAFVAVGRDFSCVLRRGGSVACWGNNEDGQLGDGKGVEPGALSLSPVEVEGLRGVKQISLGEYHACARLDGGRVSCWGNGANGQIGNADERAFGRPRRIDELDDVVQVASGASHVCARHDEGGVVCWGRHTEGQLGAEVSGSRIKPVRVVGIDDAIQLASGHTHSCAARQDGSVACWGDNTSRQLGADAGTDTRRKTPVTVAGIDDVASLAAGGQHSCARLGSARVLCWGSNKRGQLDANEGAVRPEPIEAVLANGALQLSLGLAQSCAALEGGSAICWGGTSMHVAPPAR